MRRGLVFIFLIIGFSSIGQVSDPFRQDIRGVVMNLLGQPVRGTEISVSGFEIKTTSSESGDFNIELKRELEESLGCIVLRHPKYAEVRIPLQEFRGTTGRLSVMLDTKARNCRHVIQ
jgi:hypothetical protein